MYGGGKKQSEQNIIKSIRNLYKLKKENEAIRDFDQEEKDHYEPWRVWNFRNKNYIRNKSSDDRNKKLSVKEHLDKIKPFLRDIIINPQKSDIWKIQLTVAINFISSKDVHGECVMQSKSNDMELVLYDNANEVVNEPFESRLSRCEIGLETSMNRGDFIFDSVQLIYC